MIGEIVSAGIGLIGSLFGSKKKEKTTTESTVDYVKMVKNATAAGFNPLTALRNGGSAGFTTSTTTAPTVSQVPGALAALGGALGNAFEQKTDPLAQKKRQLDTALVDYQLRQLKSAPVGSLYAGGTYSGTKVRVSKPSMGPASAKNKPGEGTIVGGDDPTVSGFGWNNGRYGYFHAPWMPDGEVNEKINGDNEIMSTLYSVGKVGSDMGYSIYRNGASAWEDMSAARKKAGRQYQRDNALRRASAGYWAIQ